MSHWRFFLPWKQTSVYLHTRRPISRLSGWHQDLQSGDLHLLFDVHYVISTYNIQNSWVYSPLQETILALTSFLPEFPQYCFPSIRIPRNFNGYQTGLFFSFIVKICHDIEVETFHFFLYKKDTCSLLNIKTFFPTKMNLKTDFLPVNFQFFKGESCQILLTWKGFKIELEKSFRTWKELS